MSGIQRQLRTWKTVAIAACCAVAGLLAGAAGSRGEDHATGDPVLAGAAKDGFVVALDSEGVVWIVRENGTMTMAKVETRTENPPMLIRASHSLRSDSKNLDFVKSGIEEAKNAKPDGLRSDISVEAFEKYIREKHPERFNKESPTPGH